MRLLITSSLLLLTCSLPLISPAENIHPPAGLVVQSHRGAGVLAPENSMEAFELGWKMGTIPEADVRTSKDGVIVAFHDKDFSRVVHDASDALKKQGVHDLTWAELQKLDIGAETGVSDRRQKILKMEDFFKAMVNRPERRLYLDIKEVNLETLAALARQYKVAEQVIFASTKIDLIRSWKMLVPGGQTLLWVGGNEKSQTERFEKLKAEDFAGVTQLQLHVKKLPEEKTARYTPSNRFIVEVAEELDKRSILFQALPWGADDAATYHDLLKLGVNSFATDHPDVVMPIMLERFRKKEAP